MGKGFSPAETHLLSGEPAAIELLGKKAGPVIRDHGIQWRDSNHLEKSLYFVRI